MVWMTVYHLCFDLNHFGHFKQDFYSDPFWTWQRAAIVSLFLLTAGLGQSVAVHRQQAWSRFGRRWLQIAGASLLVSAASYAMYPQSFIYFGVLHGLAVMLVIVRLTAGWGHWLWLAGALALAMSLLAGSAHAWWPALDVLNHKPLNWLGLVSRKPVTEDYVPLIPWLGVMWWGMAAGQWMLHRRPQWLVIQPRPVFVPVLGALAGLGRWSLSYYLLHQPVLIGALMALAALRQGTALLP